MTDARGKEVEESLRGREAQKLRSVLFYARKARDDCGEPFTHEENRISATGVERNRNRKVSHVGK